MFAVGDSKLIQVFSLGGQTGISFPKEGGLPLPIVLTLKSWIIKQPWSFLITPLVIGELSIEGRGRIGLILWIASNVVFPIIEVYRALAFLALSSAFYPSNLIPEPILAVIVFGIPLAEEQINQDFIPLNFVVPIIAESAGLGEQSTVSFELLTGVLGLVENLEFIA